MKKNTKKLFDSLAHSKTFRVFLALGYAITFVIWFPIMLVALPFYIGWHLSGYALENKYMEENVGTFDINDSKWSSFSMDLNSWRNKDGE